MALPQPFHVRKAVNRLARNKILVQTTNRNLSITPQNRDADAISIDEEPMTADETMRYLQHNDQVLLRDTHSALNTYLRQVRALSDFGFAQTSTKVLPTNPRQTYHMSAMRVRAQAMDNAWKHALREGTVLKEHLTDLQMAPYKDDMDEQLRVWEREIALLDDYEVLDLYQSSDLEDAAKLNRLTKQVNALHQRLDIAAGLESAEEPQHYPAAVTSPFAKEKGPEGVDGKGGAKQEQNRAWGLRKQARTQTAAPESTEAKAEDTSATTQYAVSATRKVLSSRSRDKPSEKPRSTSARRSRRERTSSIRDIAREKLSRRPLLKILGKPTFPASAASTKGATAAASPEASTMAKPAASPEASTPPKPAASPEASTPPKPAANSASATLSLIARYKSLAEEQRRLEADMQQGSVGAKAR